MARRSSRSASPVASGMSKRRAVVVVVERRCARARRRRCSAASTRRRPRPATGTSRGDGHGSHARSPDEPSSSVAYSRTVSSIVKRGSPAGPSALETSAASSRSSSAVGTSTPGPDDRLDRVQGRTAAEGAERGRTPIAPARRAAARSSRSRRGASAAAPGGRAPRGRAGRACRRVAPPVPSAPSDLHAGGGQLERERQPVERATDPRHRGGVRLGDVEVGDGSCGHARRRAALPPSVSTSGSESAPSSGHRERGNAVLALAP